MNGRGTGGPGVVGCFGVKKPEPPGALRKGLASGRLAAELQAFVEGKLQQLSR